MMPPELILVPIDFSESSQQSLDVATDMASRLGSALLLVHIVPAIPDLPKHVSIFNEGEYDSEHRAGDLDHRPSDRRRRFRRQGGRGGVSSAGFRSDRSGRHARRDAGPVVEWASARHRRRLDSRAG